MKKIMFMVVMMAMTITSNAMSFSEARNEAHFLSDKMAYELNLTKAQYNEIYEINLDYMLSVNGRNDVYGSAWNRRNTELQYVLTVYQYNKYMGLSYFYKPMSWKNGRWAYNVYNRYTNRNHFYNSRPQTYASYRGGSGSRNHSTHHGNNGPAPTNHTSSHNSHNQHTNQYSAQHPTPHSSQNSNLMAHNSANSTQMSHRGNKK